MPGGDRTGPLGLGPRTGRGLGDCDEKTIPIARPRFLGRGRDYYDRGFGRGYWGRGRGFGRRFR